MEDELADTPGIGQISAYTCLTCSYSVTIY